MTGLDWLVLFGTLLAIVGYGLWKGRVQQTADQYLRGGRDLKWYTIGLSIMATQASAITFLSTPGQAYEDGLGFVQFYRFIKIRFFLLLGFVNFLCLIIITKPETFFIRHCKTIGTHSRKTVTKAAIHGINCSNNTNEGHYAKCNNSYSDTGS